MKVQWRTTIARRWLPAPPRRACTTALARLDPPVSPPSRTTAGLRMSALGKQGVELYPDIRQAVLRVALPSRYGKAGHGVSLSTHALPRRSTSPHPRASAAGMAHRGSATSPFRHDATATPRDFLHATPRAGGVSFSSDIHGRDLDPDGTQGHASKSAAEMHTLSRPALSNDHLAGSHTCGYTWMLY